MKLKLFGVALALVSGCGGALQANACTPVPGWPQKAKLSPEVVAELVVSHAAHIDLVVADHFSPDAEIAPLPAVFLEKASPQEASEYAQGWRETWSDAVRIHYRVVATLLGNPTEAFVVNGEGLEGPLPTRGGVARRLKSFLDQKDLANWPGPGACVARVSAAIGQQYLVFRDSDGKLLEVKIPVQFEGETSSADAPAVVPVSGLTDAWVKLVKRAIGNSSHGFSVSTSRP